MQINKAYLFGSFAKGCLQKDSVIEIASEITLLG